MDQRADLITICNLVANETNKVDMEFNLDVASDYSFKSSNSTDIQLNATEEPKNDASMFDMTTMTRKSSSVYK